MTKTEQYDATTQTLLTRSEIASWLDEYNPTHEEFQNLLGRLTSVYEEFHSKRKEADIEAMRTLLKAKGISVQDLLGQKQTKKKGESSPAAKHPIWYVSSIGEKVQGEVADKGPTSGDLKEFLDYAKGLGITRKQIIDMTEEEWSEKFTPYINKMKK
ncbi:hypothetical protein [Aeromonas hydrophila]|uniref:hypothetical protein n=1 Tax=Aeromonas hydrophila TaxID=644 RepID=UPI003D22D8D7